jgi:hypothetical protein
LTESFVNRYQLEHLGARIQVLEHLLLALARGAKLNTAADKAESDLAAIQPPPRRQSPPRSEEHKAKIAAGAAASWALRREDLKLYLFEYQNEPPRRVDYDEAAGLLGYAPATLRIRISQAAGHSLALYKGGRHLVLAKTADGLESALRAKFEETKNPDDLIVLAARPKKAGVR